jgi:hypothetical protein
VTESVILVRGRDREEAWQRALDVGHSMEERYENSSGDTVRWAFAAVATVDELGEELRDGMEVNFRPNDLGAPIPIDQDTVFSPETFKPGVSGIGIESSSRPS